MTPLTDPRKFGPVLRDWLDRHGLTPYAAGPLLGTTAVSVGRWLAGHPCAHERAYRSLMTLIDGKPDLLSAG